LAFAGDWDATAIGTLALAIVTGVSLAFGWGSLRQTQQQIGLGQEQLEQTQREIELSRREVEEAHRPVLVPLHDTRRIDSVSEGDTVKTTSARPSLGGPPGMLKLRIPIENVGVGPALKLIAVVRTNDGFMSLRQLTALRADGRLIIEVDLDTQPEPGEVRLPNHALVLTYEDVSGKPWITKAEYAAASERYEDLVLEEGKKERRQQS
jgi:hypothetical protein